LNAAIGLKHRDRPSQSGRLFHGDEFLIASPFKLIALPSRIAVDRTNLR
jgi:hypothetical protein